MSDHYRTLARPAELRQTIQRSEFLGIAFPCSTDDDFFAALQRIEKQYFDATHHCWAFRFFTSGRQRSSDGGEPSGTAGKPILSVIEGADLFDAAVVVVRWFGGVKLGKGGLARAYRHIAAQALRNAEVIELLLYETIRVEVPFDSIGVIYRLIDPPHVVLTNESFGEKNVFTIDVRRSRIQEVKNLLTEARLKFTP